MEKQKREIRSFGGDASPTLVEDRVIEGYAVVFDQESRVMYDWYNDHAFVEVIRKSAVTEEFLKQCDVKALVEHDRSRMLARCFNGNGSLELSVDGHGVKYRFEAPNTADGDYVVEMIRRGDIFGSSFAYTADDKVDIKYSRRDDETVLREVIGMTGFYDVSPVSDPAYMGTEVNARSINEALGETKEEVKEEPEVNENYLEEVKNLRELSK